MDRGRVLSAIVLALAIVAVGTVAGGLASDASSSDGSPGVGVGAGDGSGFGQGGGIGLNTSGETDLGFPPWLGMGFLLVTVWGAAIVAGCYVVLVLRQSSLRELLAALARSVGRVAAVALVMGALIGILYLFSVLFRSGGGGLVGGNPDAGLQVPGESRSVSTSVAPVAILLVGAALVALFVVVFFSHRDDEGLATAGITKRSEGDVDSDRHPGLRPDGDVDDPDASNDVYRVWTDFRDQVGRHERSESPEDLERRARAAGYDERAVGELTALFNAVRYGDAGATSERERRARELKATLDGAGGGEREGSRNP